MTYTGGKDGSGVFQRLVNEIPPHDVFVSAFLGDCAILRRKRPARVNVGIDLAADPLAKFSATWAADAAIYGDPVPELQLYRCDAIAWLAYAFDLYRVLQETTLTVAAVDRRSAKSATQPGERARHHRPHKPASTAEAAGLRVPAGTVARFGVPFRNVFVYADPPYLLSSRRNGRRYYEHEMTDADHARLLEVLVALPCLVMVSHYPCEKYCAALSDWRTFTFQAPTRRGTATEQVWCNYPSPTVLHDVRWLGRNKREREKLMRRRRNLLGKIRRLSPVERQSLLDAVSEIGCGSPTP